MPLSESTTPIGRGIDPDLLGCSVYRSQTLMESYSALQSDQYIAVGGNQNISFSYTKPVLQQRIDRFHYLSGRWSSP